MPSTLATVADVQTLLGRSLSSEEASRAAGMLKLASSSVRAEARQSFSVDTYIFIAKPLGGLVRLHERPVVSVDAVRLINDDGSVGVGIAGWTFNGVDTINVGDITGIVINGPEDWEPDSVEVTYTAGWAEIPEDITYVCADMVKTALLAPMAPVVTEQIGAYSYRLNDNAANGAVGMNADHRKILHRYRSAGFRSIGMRP
jgi:hypothetical protein